MSLLRLAAEDAANRGSNLELAYSGGKDSECLRILAINAGVSHRLIYKDTTIDRPYTHQYVRERGAEIVRPKKPLLDYIDIKGMPSLFRRWCCEKYKEYPIEEVAMFGIRTQESSRRAARYKEPQQCRIWKARKVSQWFPILNWSQDDVVDYLQQQGATLHPLYYRSDGSIDRHRRLGCIGCPLAADRGKADYKQYPKMLRQVHRHLINYLNLHPTSKTTQNYTASGVIFLTMFCRGVEQYRQRTTGIDPIDPHTFLEDYFGIDLPE